MKLVLENQVYTMTLDFKENLGRREFLEDYRSRSNEIKTVKAYAEDLRSSLERRAQACVKNLMDNATNTCYVDEWHVEWPKGQFNLPSYESIQRGIKHLKKEDYEAFLSDGPALDQTLKAIMNDSVVLPERINDTRRSELISLLMNSMLSDIQSRMNL